MSSKIDKMTSASTVNSSIIDDMKEKSEITIKTIDRRASKSSSEKSKRQSFGCTSSETVSRTKCNLYY